MKSTLDSVIDQVARELGIDKKLALSIYKSYWLFIKDTISKLELDNMREEDFRITTTNFSIPYIGKLHTSYSKVEKYKRKINYLNHVKNKRDKTNVQSSPCD